VQECVHWYNEPTTPLHTLDFLSVVTPTVGNRLPKMQFYMPAAPHKQASVTGEKKAPQR
jgi:hypothetical protein